MLDDETRRSAFGAPNRRLSRPDLILIPLMPNKEVPSKSTPLWGVQLVGNPSEVKALADTLSVEAECLNSEVHHFLKDVQAA